ncbi:MAG: hypothetical protein ACXWVU_03270 [Sulfuricurvum sp.]
MLEWMFHKIFVAIVPVKDGHDVVILTVKNKKIIDTARHSFVGDIPSNAMNNFIAERIDASPFFYISTLNLYQNQGAYDGWERPSTHDEEIAGIKVLYREDKWSQYASHEDLAKLRSTYSGVGLDFIFSPFSMIEYYFADKIKNGIALYAYAMPNLFSVAIFDSGKLDYAYHYTHSSSDLMEAEEDAASLTFTSALEEEDDVIVSLDDLEGFEELDMIDDLDLLSDLADLDELGEVNEFSDDSPTLEEKRLDKEQGMTVIKEEIDESNEEYRRFEFIQKTLARFYASEQCRNRFIETVCIADSGNGGDELKHYLEEELFLNVLIRHVDASEGINALTQLEEEAL